MDVQHCPSRFEESRVDQAIAGIPVLSRCRGLEEGGRSDRTARGRAKRSTMGQLQGRRHEVTCEAPGTWEALTTPMGHEAYQGTRCPYGQTACGGVRLDERSAPTTAAYSRSIAESGRGAPHHRRVSRRSLGILQSRESALPAVELLAR